MSGKTRNLIACGAALCVALVGAPARAQDPMRLSLNYDGRLFVKVLDVAVDQVLDEGGYAASARIKSSGLLALIHKINLTAESRGRLDNAAVQPKTFTYVNADGRKNRRVSATWAGGDVATQSEPQFTNMGDPPASREQKLEAADPLTVLTRMTVLPPGDRPCQGIGQFFDGKQRYDVAYAYRGEAKPDAREQRLGITQSVRCGLSFREVAGFKRKPAEQRNQGLRREVTLGLGRMGANGPWVISFLRADTLLGAAEIELVNAKISGLKPTQVAAR